MKKFLIYLLIFFLILASVFLAWFFFKPDSVVYIGSDNNIRYVGKINIEGYQNLLKKYNEAELGKKPKKIIITSGGGDALVGVLIGEFIYKNNLNIHVKRYCISSCANYIFTAGKKKTISDNGLIVFHGGLFQENLLEKAKEFHQKLNSNLKYKDDNFNKEASIRFAKPSIGRFYESKFPEYKACSNKLQRTDEGIVNCNNTKKSIELNFYEKIGIDPDLPYLGQRGRYEKAYKSYEYIGFYYSFGSLKKLGVENLIEPKGWDPSTNRKFSKVYSVDLEN